MDGVKVAGGGWIGHQVTLDARLDAACRGWLLTMWVARLAEQGRALPLRKRSLMRASHWGAEATADATDVSSFAGAGRVIETAVANFGRIDIVVIGTGVTVNGISPGARTRINDVVFAGRERDVDLDPEHVAQVVAYLAWDDASDITGHIIHAVGGAIREYRIVRTGRRNSSGAYSGSSARRGERSDWAGAAGLRWSRVRAIYGVTLDIVSRDSCTVFMDVRVATSVESSVRGPARACPAAIARHWSRELEDAAGRVQIEAARSVV
jgi:hypothetical protein